MIHAAINIPVWGDCFEVTLQYAYQQLRNTPETPRNHNYIEIYIPVPDVHMYIKLPLSVFLLQLTNKPHIKGVNIGLNICTCMFFHECQLFIWTLFLEGFILKKKPHTQQTNAITLKRLKKLNVAQISNIKNYPWGQIGYIQFMNKV